MGYERDSDSYCNLCARDNPQNINKENWILTILRTSGEKSDDCVIKISQNSEKSPGDNEETYCHLNSSEKPTSNTGEKKFLKEQNNEKSLRSART